MCGLPVTCFELMDKEELITLTRVQTKRYILVDEKINCINKLFQRTLLSLSDLNFCSRDESSHLLHSFSINNY